MVQTKHKQPCLSYLPGRQAIEAAAPAGLEGSFSLAKVYSGHKGQKAKRYSL